MWEIIKFQHQKRPLSWRLANNIAYQSSLLSLRQTERAVILAQDAQLPTLNVTATQTFQPSGLAQGPRIAPVGGILDTTSSSNVTIALTVPIDNVAGKANYISSRISVMQAKLQLSQDKENLVNTILNDLDQLHSLRQQVVLSQQSVAFRKRHSKTFNCN